MNVESALSVVVLPDPVPPQTRMLARARTRAREEVEQRAGERAALHQLVRREAAAPEAPDRQDGAVERQRRDDDIDARAVGEPAVAERLGLVDAAAERREDPLDGVPEVALAREPHRRALDAAGALDPHRRRAAHHHLLDGGVGEQRLERAEAERALGDPPGELGAGVLVEDGRLAIHELPDPPAEILAGLAGARQQAVAEVGGEGVEVGHQRPTGTSSLPTTALPSRARSPGARASSRMSRANAPAAAR